jgi:hypothetical protein
MPQKPTPKCVILKGLGLGILSFLLMGVLVFTLFLFFYQGLGGWGLLWVSKGKDFLSPFERLTFPLSGYIVFIAALLFEYYILRRYPKFMKRQTIFWGWFIGLSVPLCLFTTLSVGLSSEEGMWMLLSAWALFFIFTGWHLSTLGTIRGISASAIGFGVITLILMGFLWVP